MSGLPKLEALHKESDAFSDFDHSDSERPKCKKSQKASAVEKK